MFGGIADETSRTACGGAVRLIAMGTKMAQAPFSEEMTQMLKRRDGFTLVEIMIVVLIIAILLAIAIPNFLRARDSSRAKACQDNLRVIASAKEQWAMDNRKGSSDEPSPDELVNVYIKGDAGQMPPCPSDGTYEIGNLSTWPSCTVGVNSTAEQFDDHVYMAGGG
jgi:prepilin-type N-terminal cleavage/methylation domain-containing protein